MDTPDTITNDQNGRPRRTRSATAVEPDDAADAAPEADARASSRAAPADQPTPLIVGLLSLLAHLLNARIPELVSQAKEKLSSVLHGRRGEEGSGVQERLADAGNRVVAWGRQHPGQAIAIGAAVLTTAVLVGMMVHRSTAEASERPAPSRPSRKRRKSRKITKSA
jgi:ElaB/YqjD/DUF883 family membrane-anchored ribosome-binding protein